MSPSPAATYGRLFAVREYRALFAAEVLSMVGDQVATVALAVLVYARSGSPLLAALAYALVFLPWPLAGPLSAVLADSRDRRAVMVTCDVARCLLVGLAALPGVPLAVLGGLVLLSALLGPPFDCARGALVPDVLDEQGYQLAGGVTQVVHQTSLLLGFVAGGALVTVLQPRGALALDAVSFLVSAALVARCVRPRPRAEAVATPGASSSRGRGGVRAVLGCPEVRRLLTVVWVVAAYGAVPEALAVAYARSLGTGATTVGLLMSAGATGTVVGTLLLTRVVPAGHRLRLVRPLAVLGGLLLLPLLTTPGLAVSLGVFALVGACSACFTPARAAIMTALPDGLRGRVFAVAATGLNLVQLGAVVVAGALAQVLGPAAVCALAGAVSALVLLVLGPRRPVAVPRAPLDRPRELGAALPLSA